MRRILTTFFSCTLAVMTQAADAPVLAQVTISDGQRLVKHFQAGVFGRLWNDDALAPLRAKIEERVPMIESELGFSPFAIPESLTSAQATFFGLPAGATAAEIAAFKKSPDFALQASLGKLAAQIFTKFNGVGPAAMVPGADEARKLPRKQGTLVRIGNLLLMGSRDQRLIPSPILPSQHDLTATLNGKAIGETIRTAMGAVEGREAKQVDAALTALHRFLVPMTAHLDFTPTHISSHFEAKTTLPFLAPVDLTLCGRLPATAYSIYAIGFDGAVLWDDLIVPLMAIPAIEQSTTAEKVIRGIDGELAEKGITTTLKQLMASLRGTLLFAQTPGAPFPGYTLAVPRSPELDQFVGMALKELGNELPQEGEAMPIAFPNLPLPVNVVRDRGHWLITTDLTLASTWSTTADGGWLTSPLGKLAKEKSGKGAVMLAVSDTAAELRAMQGYLGMGLGAVPLEPKEKQAIMRGFSQLIANAGLSYEVMQQRDGALVSEGQSMLGGSSYAVAAVAVIAAISVSTRHENRSVANESAAAASLKSGVHPAQVQFQAGGYRDLDKDNIGEFGFFSEMSGGPVVGMKGDVTLQLLANQWNNPMPEVNGYRFVMYLPDGKGGAYGATDKLPEKIAAAANDGERSFVAYAWPIDEDQGENAFAITQAGRVFSIPANQLNGIPAWNALFGGEGKGWQDQPTWAPHQRGGRGVRRAPQQEPKPEGDPAF